MIETDGWYMDGGVCIRAGTDAEIVTLDRMGEGLGRSIAAVAARAPGFGVIRPARPVRRCAT
jgi:hypothetical protein